MNTDHNNNPNVFNSNNNSEKSVDTIVETEEMFLFIESTVSNPNNIDSYVSEIITKFNKYKDEAKRNKKKNIAFILHSKYIPNETSLRQMYNEEITFFSEKDIINFRKLFDRSF